MNENESQESSEKVKEELSFEEAMRANDPLFHSENLTEALPSETSPTNPNIKNSERKNGCLILLGILIALPILFFGLLFLMCTFG